MARKSISVDQRLRQFIKACGEFAEIDDDNLRPLVDEAVSLPREEQAAFVIAVFDVVGKVAKQSPRDPLSCFLTFLGEACRTRHAFATAQLGARLLRRSLPLSAFDLSGMVAACVGLKVVSTPFMVHIPAIVRYIEARWEELGGEEGLRHELALLAENARRTNNTIEIKLASRILRMMSPSGAVPLDAGEVWSDRALGDINEMKPVSRAGWIAMLEHCLAASSGKPSRKWSNTASELLNGLGLAEFTERLVEWLPLVDREHTAKPLAGDWRSEPVGHLLILDHHAEILRRLCWVAGTIPDTRLARTLRDLAISCYRKVPGIGPRAVKVGNAAVYALGLMPGRDSLGQLAMLGVKVKFGTAQKLIDKALTAAAEREGLPRAEIDEIAVPAYGLTDVGYLREELGEYAFELTVQGASGSSATKLSWVNPKGKRVKAVPTAIRREHPDELKELKAAAKDIQKMLPAQRDRLDSLFLDRKTWAYSTWRERYLDHPLVGTLARRLIWLFRGGATELAGAWLSERDDGLLYGPGALVDVAGRPLGIDTAKATVSLWHPIDPESPPGSTKTRDDALEWRSFFEEREIRQPFKQAHREVYLLTDAERSTEVYSNRFAAHVLRQHQFNALCGQRNWRNRLRLMVDDEYPPAHRLLSTWNLRAEFWIEGIGDDYIDEYVLGSGAFRYLATDQVRFYATDAAQNTAHAGGGGYGTHGPDESENHPLRLDSIPPIVLSEVLRDVDLFVGVSSVGNNPEWADGGPEGRFVDYWQSYSFGDLSGTAQTRREFLRRLVPRLSIRAALTVVDKFLVVLGKKRTYKIHLGSGNILMEPNDEYLCIVPTRSMESGPGGGKLFLPFEGDRTLAIILSKAFMLADDDKITDRTIIAQIKRAK